MGKSKFFRVFVEGFTVSDGRKIEAAWIDDIVATFNTANYTPRRTDTLTRPAAVCAAAGSMLR